MPDAVRLLIGVAVPYLVAGLVDVAFKERIKRRILASGGRFSDLPSWLLHARGWHLYITGMWIALMLVEVLLLHWPWQILLGAVVFYTEDVAYYAFTWLLFGGTYGEGRFFPKQLYWLHGNIGWYKRLVGASFPLRNFLIVLALQYLLFAVLLVFFL
jgi:hypothetical protein